MAESSVSTPKDEEKKPTAGISRWEESLLKCSSFAQVFVHLNTLDRCIIWAKSILNVKCRLCRRKGMIICEKMKTHFSPTSRQPIFSFFYIYLNNYFNKVHLN